MNLKNLIEKNDTKSGLIFDFFIQFLIIFSLVSFSIETIPDLDVSFRKYLEILETIIVVIFTAEYLLRIIVSDNKLKFIFSFYGLIDLLAILPFYLNTGIDLRSIRIFRLLRLFRAFKLFRYSKAINRFMVAFRSIKSELIIFLVATAHQRH